MKLTVSIPSYNRNETLLRNLAALMPQLSAECRLLIVDNASPTPVETTLAPLREKYPEVNWDIVRNRVNIGANANIVRCFELCETPWIWVLGDDDPVRPDAIATIFQHIEQNPEAVVINFAYDGLRPATFYTEGQRELAEKLDRSADLPWISSSVYNASAILPYLKFGYQNTYSLLPHIAMLLTAIGDSGRVCLSHEGIVEHRNLDIPPEQQWSLLNFALGFPTLLDLPLAPRTRRLLADKLLRTNQGNGLHLRGIVYQLLMTGIKEGNARSALYYYDEICARSFYFAAPATRLKIHALRAVLRHPARVGRAFKRIRGRDIGDRNFQDRYERD